MDISKNFREFYDERRIGSTFQKSPTVSGTDTDRISKKKLNCRQSYISDIENGKTPISLETLLKTVEILDVDLSYFDLKKTLVLTGKEKTLLDSALIDKKSIDFIVRVAKRIAIKIYQEGGGVVISETIDALAIEEVTRSLRELRN